MADREAVQLSRVAREAPQIGAAEQGQPHPVSQPEVLNNQAERVSIKEEAARQAIARLQNIADTIAPLTNRTSEFDIPAWKSLVDSLKVDANAFQHLIGIAGDTGMGKSSLLNTLISDTTDIAPSSQNGACTAAVCCFAYPRSGENEHKFAAKVYLKSKETIDQELAAFFEELNEFEDRVQLDGENDPTTFCEREKFNDQLNIIRGWSGLSREQIQSFGHNSLASNISLNCESRDKLFNLSKPQSAIVVSISHNKAHDFLLAIKPYVGSAGKSSKRLRWPLVERVEVFLQAEILRGGIVLVDLPGEMDALDARSQVARRYYNKLDRLMVVAPGDRAVDNRTAIELIREDQILDMEADGMIDDSGLCVVVTKVDQMDWESFVDTEWPEEELPADFRRLIDALEAGKKNAADIRQSVVVLKEASEELGGKRDANVETKLHDLTSLQHNIENEVELLESHCVRRCIEARSHDTQRAFQGYFDRIRNSMRPKSAGEVFTELKVFPVSSKAYRNLAKGQPDPAFHQTASTGIDALKVWIVEGSLPKREEHADNIIHRCQVLFDAIGGWAAEEARVTVKLPETETQAISSVMKRFQATLKQKTLRRWTENIGGCFRDLQKTAALGGTGKNDCSVQRFVSHVGNYQKSTFGDKLHWATYAACIRRRGGAYKTYAKPRMTHCWQARTYGLFWGPHSLAWGQAYGQQLFDKTRSYDRKLQHAVNRHLLMIQQSEKLPAEFRGPYQNSAYKIENLSGECRSGIKEAISHYRSCARAIKSESREQIAGYMRDAYLEAQSITGKNKNARQIATMSLHAKKLRDTLFADLSNKIDGDLKRLRLDLGKTVKLRVDRFADQVGALGVKLIKETCSLGKRPKKVAPDSESKKLKGAISKDVHEWRKYWDALMLRMPPPSIDHSDEDFLSDAGDQSEATSEVDVEIEKSGVALKTVAAKNPATSKKRAAKATGNPPRKVAKKGTGKGAREKAGQKPVELQRESELQGASGLQVQASGQGGNGIEASSPGDEDAVVVTALGPL